MDFARTIAPDAPNLLLTTSEENVIKAATQTIKDLRARRDRLERCIADWAARLQWADGLDPCIEDMRKEINQ